MNKIDNSYNQLQSLLTDFSSEATIKKLELLKQCSLIKITSAKNIQLYHNNLLFLSAYSDNEHIYSAAQREMLRITDLVKKSDTLKEKLTGSGIAGSATQGAYSLTLINWLLKNYLSGRAVPIAIGTRPGTVSIHSFEATGIHPRDVLKNTLPEAEFELVNDEKLKPLKWIAKANGTNNKNKALQFLIGQINDLKASALIKDQLFESLKLYIEIKSEVNYFSRSFGTVPVKNRFFHSEGIMKKFDEQELINRKLPAERKISPTEKQEIIKSSRIALCLLNRETDPITYCEELNVKYFELERGLSIALFSIDAERRLPIESYIGFMMFKNGYPMSYGGAWLFGRRSLME